MASRGAATVGGEFWTLENRESRVRGEFTAEIGQRPEVTLDAAVADDPNMQLEFYVHSSADELRRLNAADSPEAQRILHKVQ